MLRFFGCFSLLLILAFLAFGTVTTGEIITVDDSGQLEKLEKRQQWNLKKTFFRENTTGLYYRPLITLSFTADKMFWNSDPKAMHLFNLFLHAFNAFLVFWLAQFLFKEHPYCTLLALSSSVLFLWHPLTTESVNWISGRTDVMAATFVFSSGLSLLAFRQSKRLLLLFLTIFFLFCGVLAKETAIAFLAGFVFLLWAQDHVERLNVKRVFLRGGALVGGLSLVAVVAWSSLFFIREHVLKSDTSHIATTLRVINDDLGYSFFVCARALGFYLKKIVLPLPLNFVILEVDPLYELLAFPVLLIFVYLFLKRSLAGAYILTGVALITPAFPIAFNQIAWTPFAERYVYIALGFVIPGLVYYLGKVNMRSSAYFGTISFLIILCGVVTFQRGLVWKTNESLWRDTIEKSPQSQKAWNNYGVALHEQEQYNEAKKVFSIAASKTKFGYIDKYDVNMAVSMVSLHDYENAQQKLLKVIERSKGTSDIALNVLLKIVDDDKDFHDQRLDDIYSTLLKLAKSSERPGYYYQLGRLSKEQHDYEEAKSFFEKANEVALESDPIKKKVQKALNSLP